MANNVGVFPSPGTVGPIAFGPDPGDSLFIALLAERGDENVPTLVTSFSAFQRLFGGAVPRSAGTSYSSGYEVLRQFFRKGGKRAYVVRIAGEGTVGSTTLVDRASGTPVAILDVKGKGSGAWVNGYSIAIVAGSQSDTYKLLVYNDDGDLVESYDNLLPTDADCERVTAASAYVRLVRNAANTTAAPDNLPALGDFDLGDDVPGVNDNDPTASEIVGTVTGSLRTGLKALRTYRYGRGAICAPDLDSDALVIAELEAQSLPYYRTYFTGSQPAATLSTVLTQRAAHNNRGTHFSFPRCRDVDALTQQSKTFPPFGQIIGTWWSEIALKGPGKAPAGGAFRIDGVAGIERASNGEPLIDASAAETLMAQNINPIWDRNGLGNILWGGRAASADPAWNMLSVAYLYCLIGSEVQRALDILVYEVVDNSVFDQIYMGVYAFLAAQHRRGAFRGNLPDAYAVPDEVNDAFAVLVGPEIQTPEDNNNNLVRVRIWFREALTAETIDVQIAKQTASV